MPRTNARPDSDGGLSYLEGKLGVFTHGPSPIRRNAALDVLTGRVADYRFQPAPAESGPDEPTTPPTALPGAAPLASRQASRRKARDLLYLTNSALPTMDWATRFPASPWLAASNEPRVRFRIVSPTPPPSAVRRRVRTSLLFVAAAGVLLGAGFELRTVIDRAQPAEPNVFLVDAPVAEPIAVQIETPLVVETPIVTPDETLSAPVVITTDVSPPTLVTLPPVPVPASEFGVLLDESFTSNARGWPNNPQSTAWLAGGAYQLVGRQATHFVALSIPGAQNLGDSVVTASFRKVGGPAGGGYGLILRDQEPEARDGQNQFGHYYVFEAGDRGQVGLWLRDGDRWVDLLTWTASDAVRPGTASNELTVTAMGDHLSFLVNGVPVASQTDTMLHAGAAGVFVGGDGNEVALDHVAVRVPR